MLPFSQSSRTIRHSIASVSQGAGWETRNLRIAANIQASFRDKPGAPVPVMVGAAHKPWLERAPGLSQGGYR